jgi:hypothetical protein
METKPINKTRLLIVIIITLLIATNIYFVVMYTLSQFERSDAEAQLKTQKTNEKALFFAKLFIDKVLLGESTVDFEDRLKLENSVRDINDQKIFNEWQNFTKSQTDKEVQVSAGRLLDMLFDKVSK